MNKIMTMQKQFIKYNFVAPLNLTFLISESISFSGYSLFINRDLIFSLFQSKSLSLDHNLLIRKFWLATTERLVWFR